MPRQLTTIIGGGLAGIAAALDLADNGFPVRLLEAKRRLGGRTGSFVSAETSIDYCQHVGMGCCHNLQRLTAMLGQEEHWERHEVLHFFSRTGYQRLAALPLLPAPLHLATWLWKWPELSLTDRLGVARALLSIRKQRDLPSLDEISAHDWLQKQRQSPRAIKNFWETIIVSALGEELPRVSLSAVCKVLQDGFLNDRDAFHLLVPTQPLDVLFNEGAADVLRQRGVEVVTSAPVEKIESIATSSHRNFRIQCRQQAFESEGIILAVPWHQFGKLDLQLKGRPPEPVQLESSPITGIHTWWDRPWLETPHATIVGQLCQWVFPAPKHDSPSPTSGCYYQIVISASRNLPRREEADIGQLIHSDLAEIFPAAEDCKLLDYRVVTDPLAVFSVAPGSLSQRPATNFEPGILLAGDWTNTGWPATMEGAILSGFRASEMRQREISTGESTPNHPK